MIRNQPDLEKALCECFRRPVRVVARQSVGGGSINRTSVLTLDDRTRVFLKQNSGSHDRLFEAEAAGLEVLSRAPGPRAARPLALYQAADSQYLALEYIASGSRAAGFWERFGGAMAELHRGGAETRYGFEMNNHIGQTPQINSWHDSWLEFYAECRLGYQIQLARRRGLVDAGTVAAVEGIMERLDRYLPEPDSPSLLHGDLWGGNYMVGPDGHAVLIDPAVYWGHREADLAMTELFGGFSAQFYRSYEEAWPLDPGYRERVDLYNLYHLLNHLNLFGRSYAGSVRSIIARYAP
ncbi:MAG: fructosamine kinase family protein [Spirochaetaceae bacterium]|nr:MAG: fructosamine kinase family protein [Spirochaetaceae bacterium]